MNYVIYKLMILCSHIIIFVYMFKEKGSNVVKTYRLTFV